MEANAETRRLQQTRTGDMPWRKWGPYLSERQWGTVREDYSPSGDAWNYFTHDQARSRAYRWGEDGIAGISDDRQRLCLALAFWNGQDPILKERLFGLTNSEGNHGEDVKEYYYYLDNTPTHSYMRYQYKYPQAAFPYVDLLQKNRQRGRQDMEYELIDTGIFDGNRYFDIDVEYAKETPEEIVCRITVNNRGPVAAALHLLPTLWFRNTWSWEMPSSKPQLRQVLAGRGPSVVEATHEALGQRYLYCDQAVDLLFTENETNNQRLFGTANPGPFVKDGINDRVVSGRGDAVNPARVGTKVAADYGLTLGPGEAAVVRLRLSPREPESWGDAEKVFGGLDGLLATRRSEADEFYRSITPPSATADEANVMRQALAGMLWSKQFYNYDVLRWLHEHGIEPLDPNAPRTRNVNWFTAVNSDIISLPDKWEYPWYASWDLAFHCLALSQVDPDFAKAQLNLVLNERYMHPSGQMPAYEWDFGDVNPPVHAWATMFIYSMEKAREGQGDTEFLKRIFGKLSADFTWWVNRKDRNGRGLFEGGFLGLDNIGVFDRSAALPTGGHLEQADGTAWMAFFCQGMIEMAAEIAVHDPVYQDLAIQFIDHFLMIAGSTNRTGRQVGLWDEQDGFYYDTLRLPDGRSIPLRVRSMVGLLPLCATTVFEAYQRERVPGLTRHAQMRFAEMPALRNVVHATGPGEYGVDGRSILGLVDGHRLRRILARMLDENEFLSPHGIRSLSRYHADHPYTFGVDGAEYRVSYLPAESDSGMFGGNSNWRGPVWFPVNALIIRALLQYYLYYGDGLRVECPTGSGRMMNLFEVSREIANRLTGIFLRDGQGRRPVFGGAARFQSDPHWRDNLLFYEYFHGDNGAGLGASHQTGWTGLVARLIEMYGILDARTALRATEEAFAELQAAHQAP